MNLLAPKTILGTLTFFSLAFLFANLSLSNQSNLQANSFTSLVVSPKVFPRVFILSKAGVVYDVASEKIIFQQNAATPFPLASIAKVTTALVALKFLPEDQIIKIRQEAIVEEGESSLWPGESWGRNELIKYMLISSSNDAAKALSLATEAVSGRQFIDLMNVLARDFSLTQTSFFNSTGLDNSYSLPGGLGSALDVVTLFSRAVREYPQIFGVTRLSEYEAVSLDGFRHKAINTNPEAISTPGFIASKTGFTDLAGGNLVLAFDAGPGKTIIIAILGSTQEGRFEDADALISATLEFLK